jgi:hypothetical protein
VQGDNVRLGYPGEAPLLAIDLGLKLGRPGADHPSRHLTLGYCVDQAGGLAAGILEQKQAALDFPTQKL